MAGLFLWGCTLKWQDFDVEGRARIPVGFYLVLVYLLRGYVTWIFSLTFAQDRGLILSLVYPRHDLFIVSLLVGIPAVFAFVLFGLKKHAEKGWFKTLWPKTRLLLLFSILLDLVVQVSYFVEQPLAIHWSQLGAFILGVYLIWYWLRSKTIKRFFYNWLN